MTSDEKIKVMISMNRTCPKHILNVFLFLSNEIDNSESGEIFTSTRDIANGISISPGNMIRPRIPSAGSIRRCVDMLWENGIFDFLQTNKGTFCRYPSDGDGWKTYRAKIVEIKL